MRDTRPWAASEEELLGAMAMPPAPMGALREALGERADAAGLVEVVYRPLETALGTLLVAATRTGLVSVTFDGAAPEATLDRLADEVSPRILESRRRLDEPVRRLEALVDGRRREYGAPLDLRLARGFGRDVVERLREIPYGEVRTYGQVADAVGSPRAVRAVGTACRRNPLPIAIPCHRVVRSDGTIGQYAGGEAAKRLLLAVEAGSRPHPLVE